MNHSDIRGSRPHDHDVVERERTFKDRVRGEQMQPWGVAETRALGIYDAVRDSGGHDQPWIRASALPVAAPPVAAPPVAAQPLVSPARRIS